MIDIQLSELEVKVGETLTGQLIWTPSQQTTPRRSLSRLRWRTEGRGTIDLENVQEIQIDPNQLIRTIAPITIPLEFQIPISGPISYDGVLLRVIWEVTALIEFSGGIFGKKDEGIVMIRVLSR